MIDEERIYWITRCLRLELRIAVLEGRASESPPPPAPRLVELLPVRVELPATPPLIRKIQHRVTAAEIAQMRELKRRGYCYNEIARRMHFSEQTARRYTLNILMEREVGAT